MAWRFEILDVKIERKLHAIGAGASCGTYRTPAYRRVTARFMTSTRAREEVERYMSVQSLILAGFGINCERETATAFQLAGAEADIVHLNDLVQNADSLSGYHILAVPGGFSFGDDIASGKVLANRLRYQLGDPLRRFVEDGKLVIGICNGFQAIVKLGLLPYFGGELRQEVTLTHNDRARFEDRWVHLQPDPRTVCVWVRGMADFEAPVRHGEGKFIPQDDATLDRLRREGQVALRYVQADGAPANGVFPHNPNGSVDDIAGICDPSGRIFGLMPHPEAHVFRTQHPRWYREDLEDEGAGLQVFRNGVEFAAAYCVTDSVSA